MRRCAIIVSVVLMQLVFSSLIFAQSPNITDGLNYLASIQNADGSWGGDSSSSDSLLTTAEAIDTLKVLNQAGTPIYSNALLWLQNQLLTTTDYLSKRMFVLSVSGDDLNLLLSYVDDLIRAWGGYDDFEVNNLDTALALQALQAVNYPDQDTIEASLSYLTGAQNTDGGWGFYQGDESDVYMTAVISIVLQRFSQTASIATAVNKTTAYLILRQNADGGFGSSPSTVYESALAYMALIGASTDNTVLGNGANYIKGAQSANGSWNDDPYSTALALRALYYSENKPAPPPSPTTGTVTGTVIDAVTKQALQGASAVLQSNTAISATTDTSGNFTLADIPAGNQQIAISLSGYATATVNINVTTGSVINLGSIPLSVNTSAGIIKGMVADAVNGQPLAGVTITVSGTYGGTTSTAADGTFIFTNVTPGGITISAVKTGYYTGTATATVVAGGILFFNPQLSTTPPSGSAGRLIGKVVNAATGNAIQSAIISVAGGAAASSDAQGSFAIEGIAAGTYSLSISAAGYTDQIYQVMISSGVNTDMGTISLVSAPSSTTTITGKVTDASTGRPISFAEVSAIGAGITTNTSADGFYALSGVDLLEFTLKASAVGYNSKMLSLKTANYGSYTVDIPLSQSIMSDLKINSLTTDSGSYAAFSIVTVTASLANTGGTGITARMLAQIKDSGNKIVDTVYLQPDPLSLDAQGTTTVFLKWATGRNIPGNYVVTLSAIDSVNGNLLAESSTSFAVSQTLLIEGVALSINPQFLNSKATKTINLSTYFGNKSNVNASLTAQYEVKDTTGNPINSGSVDFTLAASEAVKTVALGSFTYTFNESGQYPVKLTISSGDTIFSETTVAIHAAPSLRIEPGKTVSPAAITPDGDKRIRIGIQLKGMGDKPVAVSLTTNDAGNIITVAFDRPMADPSGKQAQFSVTVDGTPVTITAAALNSDNTKIDLIILKRHLLSIAEG